MRRREKTSIYTCLVGFFLFLLIICGAQTAPYSKKYEDLEKYEVNRIVASHRKQVLAQNGSGDSVMEGKPKLHETAQRELVIFLSIVMVSLWIYLAFFICGAAHFCRKRGVQEEHMFPPDRHYAPKKSLNLCIVVGGLLISTVMTLFGCLVLAIGAFRLHQEEVSSPNWLFQHLPGKEYETARLSSEQYPDILLANDGDLHLQEDQPKENFNDGLDFELGNQKGKPFLQLKTCEDSVLATSESEISLENSFTTLQRSVDMYFKTNPSFGDSDFQVYTELSELKRLWMNATSELDRYLETIRDAYLREEADDITDITRVHKRSENLDPSHRAMKKHGEVSHAEKHSILSESSRAEQKKNESSKNVRMSNKGYIIFPAAITVVILSVLFALPVLIGTFLGLNGTACFKTHRDYFYKRTKFSNVGAKLMEVGFYSTSVFLWIFWAVAALIFIVSAIPVDSCILLRKLEMATLAENLTDDIDPSQFGKLTPRLRKILSNCDSSDEFFLHYPSQEQLSDSRHLEHDGAESSNLEWHHEIRRNRFPETETATANNQKSALNTEDTIEKIFGPTIGSMRVLSKRLKSLCSALHDLEPNYGDKILNTIGMSLVLNVEASCRNTSRNLLSLEKNIGTVINSCIRVFAQDRRKHLALLENLMQKFRMLSKTDDERPVRNHGEKEEPEPDARRIVLPQTGGDPEMDRKNFFSACIRAARQEATDFDCDVYLYSVSTCWLGLSVIATFTLTTILFSIPAVHIFKIPEGIDSNVNDSSGAERSASPANPQQSSAESKSSARSEKAQSDKSPT